MRFRVINIPEKKLIGKRMTMSHADYRIGELWGSFMPRRKEITNNLTSDLISLVVYAPGHFANYKPDLKFERWAVVEVSDFSQVPNEMENYTLPGGLYAVFHYAGPGSGISQYYRAIFDVWLPASEYELDERAHFEVLGTKYSTDNPASEEEIWIPVRRKKG